MRHLKNRSLEKCLGYYWFVNLELFHPEQRNFDQNDMRFLDYWRNYFFQYQDFEIRDCAFFSICLYGRGPIPKWVETERCSTWVGSLPYQLYDNWQFLFLFTKQTDPNQSKQEVNGTVILPPLVFPAWGFFIFCSGINLLTGVLFCCNRHSLKRILCRALWLLCSVPHIFYCSAECHSTECCGAWLLSRHLWMICSIYLKL